MNTIVLAMIAIRIVTAMVVAQAFIIVALAACQQLYKVFRGERKPTGTRGASVARPGGPVSPAPQGRRHSLEPHQAAREPLAAGAMASRGDSHRDPSA